MKQIMLSSCIISLLYSCDTPPDKPAPSAEKPIQADSHSDLSGCYMMSVEKDTAYLQLTQTGDSLSGPLVYKRFEKDSNTGIVSLQIKGDKAEGLYKFQSEGTTSYRQIIFRNKNNMLAEAYGDIGIKGDTAFFKYPATLQFEDKHPFTKTACK